MSLAIIHSRAQLGVHAPAVTVEVHLSGGLPALSIVGLPEAGVRESRDRVRSALLNAGFEFPQRRITINLAPADLPKSGGRYDLAIALGILQASGQLPAQALEGFEVLGELTLGGAVRAVRGALPAALAVQQGEQRLILPLDNASEAALVEGLEYLPVNSLLQVCAYLSGQQAMEICQAQAAQTLQAHGPDLADVQGQPQARRALEVAAAGQHNLLMAGPPGSGKSMLAARLPGLLPPLQQPERLAVAAIHSVAGHPVEPLAQGIRPFRNPHHTASAVAMVGGGSSPAPGEISLAHQGVLFLDELPEFPRKVLEVLREPLETGVINISRAAGQTAFPAAFQLVAAMNPCPCGYYGDVSGRCRCTPDQVARYQGRLSGPLLDRFDMQLSVAALPVQDLLAPRRAASESSAQVQARVIAARERQLKRQGKANQALSTRELEKHCALDDSSRQILAQALERLGLSARACHRVMRVARTLADLESSEEIHEKHLLEALSYRSGLVSYFSAAGGAR